MASVHEHEEDESFWAPGTVTLEDIQQARDSLLLFPEPSEDPNDPLNWSKARKLVNFTQVSFFVLWTFVQLDIGFTAWGPMQTELGMTIETQNAGAASNYAGLAVGSIFFIPLVHKYGRRPIYMVSCALQFAACIWQARTFTGGDLIGANLVSGLGGAISEIIVQITVADMFFVHQHATMNGWFVIFETTGAFLGPVASGYIAITEGWRWMWWYCVIFLGVTLVCVIFFFEESKYVPVASRRDEAAAAPLQPTETNETENKASVEHASIHGGNATAARVLQPKSYRQRMALVTSTRESILPHLWQPVITLFSFPAVAYTAITYGFTLSWFAILTSIQATYLIQPPYNFNASGVGLMNLAPFIGAIPGFVVGGYLSDKSIVWLSKRNGGIYEPEMRLWLTLPLIIVAPGGILMFGLGLAYEVHWSLLAVGFGVFGFDLAAISGLSLSYVMDCYQDIIGDALVGVVFVRNILSVIVLFVLTPWVKGMGLQNLHILVAVLAFLVMLIPIPLLKWGKKARIATMVRYRKMAKNQLTSRTI